MCGFKWWEINYLIMALLPMKYFPWLYIFYYSLSLLYPLLWLGIKVITRYYMKYFILVFISFLFLTCMHVPLLLFLYHAAKMIFLLFHRKNNYQIYYYYKYTIINRMNIISKYILFLVSFNNSYFFVEKLMSISLFIGVRAL